MERIKKSIPMKYYQTRDELIIEAKDAKDLVLQMRNGGSFSSRMTIQEYMEYNSEYFEGTYDIRTDSEENWLADNLKAGLIKVLSKADIKKLEKQMK
jgi:hypothetical protein